MQVVVVRNRSTLVQQLLSLSSVNGLRKMNNVLGDFNIEKQICESKGAYPYFMADIKATDPSDIDSIYEGIASLPEALSTRITY